jgi:serine/threonine protein kinase/tetratricopeptide (TPR) repeat protein
MSDVVVFGRYQIIRRLATGGMGEIFLARQRGVAGFDRLAILKSLLPELAEDEASLSAFLDEARVAANLNHPNVVAVYEVDQWEGVYFLAMEYIAGIDLSRLSRVTRTLQMPTPPALLAAVFRDACRGLGYAHMAVDANGAPLNLVHRDATPHNIMLRKDGTAKVVDFGVAKAANRAVKTSTGVLKGKLQYMPPEQVRGEEVTARSDQWALGASLWEMLVGRRMITPTEPLEVFRAILTGKFPPPSSAVESVPPGLDAIVGRMIAPDPAARFASCVEAADALDDFARGAGIKQGHVAEFVARVAGATIDAVTADLTPQPVSIQGRKAPAPPATSPSSSSNASPSSSPPAGTPAPGAPRARFCGACGTPAPTDGRFCMSCGTPLAPLPSIPVAAPSANLTPTPVRPSSSPSSSHDRLPTPGLRAPTATPASGSRVPAAPTTKTPSGSAAPLGGAPIDVARLGLEAADALMRAVVEKRTVCVVRASVAGALGPADQPELALQRGDALVAALARAVSDGGGVVESAAVDNLCFSVGAEQTREDDAVVAVRLAFAVDDVVRRCATAWGVPIGLRAAVDCGPAVVTDTAQGKRVSGAPKDRATSIERRVGAPRVLVSVDVARLVRRAWETAAPFTVKDDNVSLEVAQVTGLARAVERGSLFVGRKRELDEVARALAQRPSRTFLVGASGTGRTALLDEVARRAAASGLHAVRASARNDGSPYAVARALVTGDLDVAAARERLAQLGLPEAMTARLLRVFFGEGAAPRAADAADAMVLDEAAVVDALVAASAGAAGAATGGVTGGATGGVVLVDDWGSVDAGSRAALARAGSGAAAVAVVVTALPEDVLPEGATRIALDPLGDVDLRALVARELDVDDVPQPLAAYVSVHAGGSPSLARLIVEGLVDSAVVAVHAGRATVAPGLASTPAPASVLRVYEARFDRLTDETRALLRAAAVVGDEFSIELAGAVIGVDGQLRAPALLAPAQQAGLVQPTSPSTYAFRQGLRASLLSRTVQSELLALHRRALELLETKATDHDVALLQAIAGHAEAARDDGRFVGWAWRAARALDARGVRVEAIAWFRRALDVAGRLARQTSAPQDVAALVQIVTEATTAGIVVDAAAAADLWTRYAAPLAAGAGAELRCWGLRAHGRALVAAGRAKEAIEVFDTALEAVPDGDDDTRALLLSDLGGALETTGDIQGAAAQLVEAFRHMQGRQNRHAEFAFEALNRLGRLYLRSKQTAKARDAFKMAQAQAEAVGDEAGASRCEMNLGTCAALDGEVGPAQQLFAAAAARAAAVGDVTQAARARLNLGRLLSQASPAQARAVLGEALADAERVGWKEGIAMARNVLGAIRG